MRTSAMAWAAAVALVFGSQAQAAPRGLNCPMAFAPYSGDSSLLDLLTIPEAKAVVAATVPKAAAMSLSIAGVFSLNTTPGLDPAEVAAADKALRRVPVTLAAARHRCAPYDETPPAFGPIRQRPAVLVFSKTTGFRDGASIDAANAATRRIAEREGWTAVFTENGAAFDPAILKRFRAVVWNSVSGDVLTVGQRRAFRAWIEHGGGFVATHGSGGDFFYDWAWYRDQLLGARFIGHTGKPQFREATVRLDDAKDPMVRALPATWTMTDEWYSFAESPRGHGAIVVAPLDEDSYGPDGRLKMGDHPIAWRRCVGDGRSFFSAIGHRPETYSDPNHEALLDAGLRWAMGQGATACRAGKEVAAKR